MPVKYLSPEWIDEYNAALAKDDAVRGALKGKNAAIQMVVSGAPQGEVRYWLRIADGTASAGLGDNPPTAQDEAVRRQLTAAIDAQLAKLQEIWDRDLPAFNQKVREANVPAIGFPPEKAETP